MLVRGQMGRFNVKGSLSYVLRSRILERAFRVLAANGRYSPLRKRQSKPLLIVTLCLGPAVNTVYKQKQARSGGRTIYVISVIMAVLIVAFLTIIVYLKVQHRKSAVLQTQNTSSGSISKSTQSTVQQPSFDLKQSISEIKSCVFNQVSSLHVELF